MNLDLRDQEVAQQVKASAAKPDNLNLIPQNPHGRRESALISYLKY